MKKENKEKSWLSSFSFAIMGLAMFIFVLLFFNACAEPQIVKVNVPTPCEVSYIPKEPKAIDIENASVGFVMEYVRDIVQYAKELKPIINRCVKEKSMVGTKDLLKEQ